MHRQKNLLQIFILTIVLVLILLPTSASAAFDRPLAFGSVGEDVRELQQFLKDRGFFLLEETTTYFGRITEDALARYQAAVGLDPVGQLGPQTRALLNGAASTTLSLGSRGPEVSALQQFLKDRGFFTYPEITDFFGPITQAALQAFQLANNLTPSGTVDTDTHTKITETQTPSSSEEPTEEDSTPVHVPPHHTHSSSPDSDPVPSGGDTTAPVRSAGSPSGTLALNTTSTTISLTTDETATCAYATSPGTAYGSMTPFTTTGTTSHSSSITGLTNGGSYIYYVRCTDASTNTNTDDYTISFTVAADSTSPTVSLTAPLNNATVSGSAVALTATASDDVSVAGVQFKLDTSTNIGVEDTSPAYATTWNSTAVADGAHTLIAVARDGSGHYATSSVVNITVDNTGPILSSIASSTTNTTATVTWTTNELSDSRLVYGTTSSYGTASSSASLVTSHTINLSGLTSGTLYHYAVVSTDGSGNTATSSDQTFTTQTFFDIAGLPNWSAAVRGVQAGTNNAAIVFYGDSTTRGLSELATNRYLKAWPSQVATGAASAGYNVNYQNSFGAGSIAGGNAGFLAWDQRWAFTPSTGGWSLDGGSGNRFALGGSMLRAQTTGSISFTPTTNVDTFEIYTIKTDGTPNATGSFSYNIDGGSATTFSETGTDGLFKITVNTTLGAHTVNISWVSGSAYIAGVNAYNSSVKQIHFLNGGSVGITAAEMVSANLPWSAQNIADDLGADLAVIMLGENDLLQGIATSTTSTSLQTLITSIKNSGKEVVIMTPIPVGSGSSDATQEGYAQVIRDLATNNNIPLIDIKSRWGTYAAKQPLGWYSDTNHPSSGPGYGDIAAAVLSRIFGI